MTQEWSERQMGIIFGWIRRRDTSSVEDLEELGRQHEEELDGYVRDLDKDFAYLPPEERATVKDLLLQVKMAQRLLHMYGKEMTTMLKNHGPGLSVAAPEFVRDIFRLQGEMARCAAMNDVLMAQIQKIAGRYAPGNSNVAPSN